VQSNNPAVAPDQGAGTEPAAIALIPVWKQVDAPLREELVAFWQQHRALAAGADAHGRAGQAVCIARDGRGALVGVSTAFPRVIPRLRQPMYCYRNFIAAPWRGQRLAAPFLMRSRTALQVYNAALETPESIGMLIELENRALAMHRSDAHWSDVGFTFIGYSRRGLPLRVSYFDGARLLAPVDRSRSVGAYG
jgi:hypothetical protein